MDTPDVELGNTDDDAVRSDDADTEQEILNELHKTDDDSTYTVFVSRVLGAARHGATEPHIIKGDARVILPNLYERLQRATKPGEIGNFRVRIQKNGKYWRKFDVAVERLMEDETSPQPKAASSEVASMLAAFQASQDRMLQMIEQRFQQISAPQTAIGFDPFASLEKLTTIVKNIMPATPVAPTNNAKELFEAFKSGIDAVTAIGSSDKETGIMDVVQSMLNSPVIARAIEAATTAAMMPGAVPQAAPSPAPQLGQPPLPPIQPQSSPQPTQQPVPQMTVQQILTLLTNNPPLQAQAKQACDYLTSLAQRGADIETSAFFVCDNWDRRFIDFLLGQNDWYALVCAVSPEARGYGAWFQDLVAEVRDIVKDSDEAERQRGNSNGHAHPPAVNDNGNTGRQSGGEDDAEMDGEPG